MNGEARRQARSDNYPETSKLPVAPAVNLGQLRASS